MKLEVRTDYYSNILWRTEEHSWWHKIGKGTKALAFGRIVEKKGWTFDYSRIDRNYAGRASEFRFWCEVSEKEALILRGLYQMENFHRIWDKSKDLEYKDFLNLLFARIAPMQLHDFGDK